VEQFINEGQSRFISVLHAVGLWLPALINLSGVKNMGSVQVWTSVIKFAALAFMATMGRFFISTANLTSWNVSGESAINAIGGGMAIALRSSCSCSSPSLTSGCGQRPAPAS
jgi:APA family basic amino acid/polyamine antiporter